MDLVTQIKGNFPKTLNKSKPVFSALIANDKNTASIHKQLKDLKSYTNEWISTPNVYNQSGEMLDKTIRFFSFLERFTDETEKSIKNRFHAIFVRNHDTVWGTLFDVKSVFSEYFPHADIYVVENTNKIDDLSPELANQFTDGDIEAATTLAWTLTNCSIDKNARFSGSYGILLDTEGGILSQTVDANPSSVYFLHFFLKGKVCVKIQNNNNQYWNFTTKSWSDTEVGNNFSSDDWNNKSMFIMTDSETESLDVSFCYVDEETYIDYFRLFEKQPYSSFTVIAHFAGSVAQGAFGLAAGDDDPNVETQESTPPLPRYNNYGYFDSAFLSGAPIGFAKDIYEDLLDYLRAQGVKAYLEILIQDLEI